MKKSIGLAVAVLAVAGCSTPPAVIPQAGGIYKTIAYGESQRVALDSALTSAENACQKQKKRYEVSEQKDEYLSSLPEAINKVATTFLLLDGSEDYRVTLSFACV